MRKNLKLYICAILAVLIFGFLLFAVASCIGGRAERPLTAAQMLDLGERYLLDLNFEQALVHFNMLIFVEPMNPRGYTGAAEAHIGLGDTDSAVAVLQLGLAETGSEEISAMLDELIAAGVAFIPPENRGIFFTRLYSASEANPDWLAGAVHYRGFPFVAFDITQHGTHTLEILPGIYDPGLPLWPRSDDMWIQGSTSIFYLQPSNPSAPALPVTIESISFNGIPRITNQTFAHGGFWNYVPGVYFGNIKLDSRDFYGAREWGGSYVEGFNVREFAVTDIPETVLIQTDVDYNHWAGASESLGVINEGDIITITFRVGDGINEDNAESQNTTSPDPSNENETEGIAGENENTIFASRQEFYNFFGLSVIRGMTIYDVPGVVAGAVALFEDGPPTTQEEANELNRIHADSRMRSGWFAAHGGEPSFTLPPEANATDYQFGFHPDGSLSAFTMQEEAVQRLWGFQVGVTTKDAVVDVLGTPSRERLEGLRFTYAFDFGGDVYWLDFLFSEADTLYLAQVFPNAENWRQN